MRINSIENHSNKINAAFHTSIITSQDPRDAIQKAVDLMLALKKGREPSMYTDINYMDSKIYVPNSVIRDVAAKDSVRLSEHCYSTTLNYINNSDPSKKSKVDDAVFGLKSKTFNKIMEQEDFWWYLIDNQEKNNLNHNEVIIKYNNEYFSKSKLFKAP